MNMVIRKKHIILASLVVGLGLAVYVNYQFAQADNALTPTAALESDKNYGDAQLVDSKMCIRDRPWAASFLRLGKLIIRLPGSAVPPRLQNRE